MTTWLHVSPIVNAQPIGEASSSQRHPLGTIVQARAETEGLSGEFIYLSGASDFSPGDWARYAADTHTVALLDTSTIGPVAVAVAASTSGQFAWFQLSGRAVASCGTGSDGQPVYVSGPGYVEDGGASGDRVKGAMFASDEGTPDAFFAYFSIQRPYMDDGLSP